MDDDHEIEQGVRTVRLHERPIYSADISNVGNTPSSVSVVCYRYIQSSNLWTDVTALCFPVNTPSVSGNRITFSPFVPQAIGHNYRVEFTFTISGGSVLEGLAHIDCK